MKQGLRGKTSTGHPQFIKLEAMTLEEQNEYLRMENGKPDYKAFDGNLAKHITDSFKEHPKGYRYHWR